MRTLEIRRHSLRKTGGGSQLSQAGVDLARGVGASMGPFACVAASVVPRTRETALAMGFAVDQELVSLITDDTVTVDFERTRWWDAPAPFAELHKVVAAGGAAHRYATAMVGLWRDLLMALPEGAAALVVGHSGQIEAALVAMLPARRPRRLGRPTRLLRRRPPHLRRRAAEVHWRDHPARGRGVVGGCEAPPAPPSPPARPPGLDRRAAARQCPAGGIQCRRSPASFAPSASSRTRSG
jgi:broad specificity phosphatase PhoE